MCFPPKAFDPSNIPTTFPNYSAPTVMVTLVISDTPDDTPLNY